MLASDRGGLLASLSRTLRLVFQSAVLGLGAYLAIRREISPGVMIAASIIMSRALAPIELAVGQWPQFQGFVRSWHRLKAFLADTPARKPRMELPQPTGRLTSRTSPPMFPAWKSPGRRRVVRARTRGWARHHRPDRCRQIDLGARTGRRLAIHPRYRQI